MLTAAAGLLAVLFAIALFGPRQRMVPARSTPRQLLQRAHRGPAAAWDAGQRRAIRTAIAGAFAPVLANARAWSCAVLGQDGSVLYADRALVAVVPASTQKVIVADAALELLGPQFRFNTLLASAQPPRDGTVDDLWLIGSGDPSFRSSALLRGVRSLRKGGVQRIAGGVAVDGSAIAGDEINAAWNENDANEDFMAATSGSSLDEDTVEFHVTGTSAGSRADIYVNPSSAAVRYVGSVATADGDDVVIAGTGMPNSFRVSGVIPPGIKETFYLPVHGISQYAGEVLTSYLRSNGIPVGRPPSTGNAPLGSQVLWNHRSDSLAQLVRHMLVLSDNHYAEQLMRTLGGIDGAAANDADGIAAELHVLRAQGVPVGGLHLVDGSGLAHDNRVAAMTLARILAALDTDAQGNLLYPLLARGGRDGTLRMYHFTWAAGRVRAKSGHLADASALAGYVQTREHGRLAFAFLVDGSAGDPDAAFVAAIDRLAVQ